MDLSALQNFYHIKTFAFHSSFQEERINILHFPYFTFSQHKQNGMNERDPFAKLGIFGD